MSALKAGETAASTSYKARLIASHIARYVEPTKRPLMVGLQGPQGCGKTTVCNAIIAELKDSHGLSTAVLSLDDLYHTNKGLKDLAAAHPEVKLLAGRGQPGTHDIDLASRTLSAVTSINSSKTIVELPIFDKSLCGGEGDRSKESVKVEAPLDVFILEGWSMGFAPLSKDQLEETYQTSRPVSSTPSTRPGDPPYFTTHSLSSLLTVNEYLSAISSAIYPFFSVFVQIEPTTYQDVFKWRLEQEHMMKKANGGKGMSDEQVDAFVQRYMPGYELWKEGIWQTEAPWTGRGLRLVYGSDREVVTVDEGESA